MERRRTLPCSSLPVVTPSAGQGGEVRLPGDRAVTEQMHPSRRRPRTYVQCRCALHSLRPCGRWTAASKHWEGFRLSPYNQIGTALIGRGPPDVGRG